MTLLISAITHQTVFSISDRLLTQRYQHNNFKEFDQTSNKTVVYSDEHGMFSLTYTGTAYLGDKTTDRWIAEKLSGIDLEEGSNFVLQKEPKKWCNIGYLINNLVHELNTLWPTMPLQQRQADLGLLIAGWQYVRSKPKWRPILWGLEDGASLGKTFKLQKHPRFYPQRYIALGTAGILTTKAEQRKIIEKIENERKNGSPSSAQKIIIKEFQKIAKSHPTVGKDCMSIRLSWASTPYITIEYHPDPDNPTPVQSSPATLDKRSGMLFGVGPKDMQPINPVDIENRGAYFCPWVITNHSVTPPSSIVGTFTIKSGSKDLVKIVGGLSPPSIIGGFLAQKRPLRP